MIHIPHATSTTKRKHFYDPWEVVNPWGGWWLRPNKEVRWSLESGITGRWMWTHGFCQNRNKESLIMNCSPEPTQPSEDIGRGWLIEMYQWCEYCYSNPPCLERKVVNTVDSPLEWNVEEMEEVRWSPEGKNTRNSHIWPINEAKKVIYVFYYLW